MDETAIGQDFTIEDLVGNFNTYNVTVVPPAGHTISGLPEHVMKINRGSNTFRWYGNNLWSVS